MNCEPEKPSLLLFETGAEQSRKPRLNFARSSQETQNSADKLLEPRKISSNPSIVVVLVVIDEAN